MRLSTIAAVSLMTLAAAIPAQADAQRAPAAAERGHAERYRAVGTEPFWTVTIANGEMRYETPEGVQLVVPQPDMRTSFNGRYYRSRRMSVDITYTKCSDGMSDRVYPHRVTVTIGRKVLRGCGSDLAERESLLEGDYSIRFIDGRPPLARTEASMRFEGDRVSGSTGCNRFGGTYRFERGRLIVGPLMSTKRACPGPLNAQERKIMALLAQPLTVSSNRNGLVLTARNGDSLSIVRSRPEPRR